MGIQIGKEEAKLFIHFLFTIDYIDHLLDYSMESIEKLLELMSLGRFQSIRIINKNQLIYIY